MTAKERVDALWHHVNSVNRAPFVWGVNDCTRWAANWAEIVLGHSLELPAYASEAEARAMVAEAGSLEALWSENLADAGIHQCFDPECGDVAIVSVGRRQIGAVIATGGNVLVRTELGVDVLRPRNVVKAWAL